MSSWSSSIHALQTGDAFMPYNQSLAEARLATELNVDYRECVGREREKSTVHHNLSGSLSRFCTFFLRGSSHRAVANLDRFIAAHKSSTTVLNPLLK